MGPVCRLSQCAVSEFIVNSIAVWALAALRPMTYCFAAPARSELTKMALTPSAGAHRKFRLKLAAEIVQPLRHQDPPYYYSPGSRLLGVCDSSSVNGSTLRKMLLENREIGAFRYLSR